MNSLVSVIIPTFNRAHIIERCLASVFQQTYKNIEIVVVDDGSGDNTKEVLAKYEDKIKYIYQENQGVSSARNNGVKNASGHYLAFLDSDDEWLPGKIEKQVNAFSVSDEVAIVTCRAFLVEEHGNNSILPALTSKEACLCVFDDIFQFPYLGIPNIMIVKSIFDELGGFNTALNTAEDLDLFIRVAVKYKVYAMADVLTNVYQTEGSLSSSTSSYEDNIKVVLAIRESNAEVFRGKDKMFNTVLARLYIEYARTLLWYKEYSKAYTVLRSSLKYKLSVCALWLILKTKLLKLLS